MKKYVHNLVGRIHSKEEGVTALEYALIASAIAALIVVAVRATGTGANTTFQAIATALGQ